MKYQREFLLIVTFPCTSGRVCKFADYVYRLTDNAELLKRRLKSLEDSREQLDCSLKEQIAYNRTLEREMHKLKPELLQLVRQRDKHLMYVY